MQRCRTPLRATTADRLGGVAAPRAWGWGGGQPKPPASLGLPERGRGGMERACTASGGRRQRPKGAEQGVAVDDATRSSSAPQGQPTANCCCMVDERSGTGMRPCACGLGAGQAAAWVKGTAGADGPLGRAVVPARKRGGVGAGRLGMPSKCRTSERRADMHACHGQHACTPHAGVFCFRCCVEGSRLGSGSGYV